MTLALAASTLAPLGGVQPVLAQSKLSEGTVVKVKGSTSLYYIGSAGKRYVFPNEQTFLSWYDDFSGVVEANPQDVAPLLIGGNVRYKPGALLIKIESDPKVYAVSSNGVIRWVKTETLAKQLYGDKWNLLVDDVPVAFFANYNVGTAIESAAEFDPEGEETVTLTISDSFRARIVAKQVSKNLEECEKAEHQLAKIQKRLRKRGLSVDSVVDGFIQRCIASAIQPLGPGQPIPVNDDDDDDDDNDGKKVTICHIPPGNASAKTTISIGWAALKAHVKHGDTLGACSGQTHGDTTAPVISAIVTTPHATSTDIGWTTNEPATSKVVYATQTLATASSTFAVANGSLVTAHAAMLPNLTPSTLYYFRVESADAKGNVATSTEQTFTTTAGPAPVDTTAPVISQLSATSTNQTTASVTWQTNENATGKVTYATQPLITASTTQTATHAGLLTSHAINLSGLTAQTTYYFRVESADSSGNTATSSEMTFTTKPVPPPVDTTAPIISGLTVTPQATTTVVAWTTNEASTSKATFATQTLVTATSTESAFNATLTTSHSLTLQNLATSTLYFFLVMSADASGNTATSTETTFMTLP